MADKTPRGGAHTSPTATVVRLGRELEPVRCRRPAVGPRSRRQHVPPRGGREVAPEPARGRRLTAPPPQVGDRGQQRSLPPEPWRRHPAQLKPLGAPEPASGARETRRRRETGAALSRRRNSRCRSWCTASVFRGPGRGSTCPWLVVGVADVDEELVDKTQLTAWLAVGGRRIGLGDWRPEKSGVFGRFDVAGVIDPRRDAPHGVWPAAAMARFPVR